VVARLLDLDESRPAYFDELVGVLELEPNFAVRVVRAANSLTTRGVSPIKHLREAVVGLGAREVSNLVFGMSVVDVFVPRTDSERGLWVHSVEVATVARCLAQHAELSLDHEATSVGS
jgi:HD-like signal output (HDOD) protein